MRNTKQISVLLFSLFLYTSCVQKKTDSVFASETNDLNKIISTDTLKVAMMYGSSSYFIYRGETMGFDYEMATSLADKLKVNLEINIANNEDEMTQLLKDNKVDVACSNFIETKALKDEFDFVLPQFQSYLILVQKLTTSSISDIHELEGKTIHVKENSIFHKRINEINDEIGGSINIVFADDTVSSEDLIDMVGEKKIEYTLAYHNTAILHKSFYKNLDCHMKVGFEQRSGWLIRKNNPKLKEAIEMWQNTEQIATIHSNFYNKYWKENPYFALQRIKIPRGSISPYDHLIKKYSALINWDWHLLAALVFHESRFDAKNRSWAGAAGLMQLMPRTAASFGLNSKTILDPEMNIEAGVQYIKSLSMTFRSVTNKEERIKFILAGYNSGPAHILDAMALAKKHGKNPEIWFDNVEYYLLKKNEPEYYQDKVVKYGYYRGKITAKYVHDVLETRMKYLNKK